MKIVLDAGHGFATLGKQTPDGMKEYEFNRAVAHYARNLLSDYANLEVLFSHSDEQDVLLKGRTDLANRLGADCFLSIHANAAGNGDWHEAEGIETFIHTSKLNKTYFQINTSKYINQHPYKIPYFSNL